MKIYFSILLFVSISWSGYAQTQVSPKYSVDADVNALASYGDTVIVGGNFNNVGVYTGGGALFTTNSGQPNLNFQKIIGNIKSSTPDGAGGFYVYGDFRKEGVNLNTFFPPRIEHILPDYAFDTAFSLPVDALFGVNKILYHNGLLYIGGSYMNSINGQPVGDLSIINVATKQFVSWSPAVTAVYLGGITGLHIAKNTLYIMGGFTAVGGQARKNIAAIELYSGIVKPWDFGANFSTGYRYNDIKSYKDKVILAGDFYIGGTPQDIQHACALVDTTTGLSVEYVFKAGGLFGNGIQYLYFAATAHTLALSGDTLFTFTGGTFDTRVTAINLADSNKAIWGKYFNMIAGASKMEVIGDALYVAGSNFTDIYLSGYTNGDTAYIERKIRGAVKLNAVNGALRTWHPDPVAGSAVFTMSVTGDNIFLGGNFTHVNSFERTGIVMLKMSTQEVLPFSINLYGHSIRSFKILDSTLYAAGSYFQVNGTTVSTPVLPFSLRTGALLPWRPKCTGVALSIEGNSQHIFLGGNLNDTANDATRKNLFAADRTSGDLSAWSPNPSQGVTALHLSRGKLYVGGNFTAIADSTRKYLAAFDTASLSITTWNPNPNWTVNAINSSFGTIWIGGLFYEVGGAACYSFAGINANTGRVTHKPLLSYPGPSSVNAIATKGCYAFFGSPFRLNNTDPCNDLFGYDMFNKTLIPSSALCQNVNDLGGNVKALTIIGNDLYFGGNFIKVNGKANATHLERIKLPPGYFIGCQPHLSAKSGNWNDPATWESGSVPPENARVMVRNTVTVTETANCFSLDVEPGSSVLIKSGVQLKVFN